MLRQRIPIEINTDFNDTEQQQKDLAVDVIMGEYAAEMPTPNLGSVFPVNGSPAKVCLNFIIS